MADVKNAEFQLNPLIPVTDALDRLLSDVQSHVETETVSINQALGRVLAEQPVSLVDVPRDDNSSMDGYAVALASLNSDKPTVLPLSQRIAAGDAPQPLAANTVARIFTGAEIPANADAVVMQEKVTVDGDNIQLPVGVELMQNIRPKGQDLKAGELLYPVGKKLQPADLGVLASAGISTLSVYKPLKVAILSTGDELIEPGEEISAGKLYNSNRAMLSALVKQLSMEVVDLGKVKDTLEATKAALLEAAQSADIIITTGGVSVGDEDHVKSAVDALGQLDLWRIKLKPGKPLAYGRVKETPIFGLPGNPASALITFCLFARPYMLKLQGAEVVKALKFKAVAGFDHTKAGTREEYMRGVYEDGTAMRFNNQSSGMLSTASRANGLIVVPVDATFKAGDWIDFIPFSELLK